MIEEPQPSSKPHPNLNVRASMVREMEPDKAGACVAQLPLDQMQAFLSRLDNDTRAAVVEAMDLPTKLKVLNELTTEEKANVLAHMSPHGRRRTLAKIDPNDKEAVLNQWLKDADERHGQFKAMSPSERSAILSKSAPTERAVYMALMSPRETADAFTGGGTRHPETGYPRSKPSLTATLTTTIHLRSSRATADERWGSSGMLGRGRSREGRGSVAQSRRRGRCRGGVFDGASCSGRCYRSHLCGRPRHGC